MSTGQWGLLAGVAVVVLVGFVLLMWRLVVARRWRLVAAAVGFVVLVVFIGGFCGYRYGYYDALRGGVAHARGDLDVAIRWFERAYSKNPNAFMVAHDIACCYALKGDDDAMATYDGVFQVTIELRAGADAAAGATKLAGKLGYQACDHETCRRPADVAFEVPVTVTK